MNVVGNTADSKAFAFVVPNDSGEVGVEIGSHNLIENRSTVLRAEDNMDKKKAQRSCHGEDYRSGLRPSDHRGLHTWGFAPRWYISAPPAFLLATFVVCVATLSGCKSAPAPTPAITSSTKPVLYPPHPAIAPPPFKVFHQTDNSITLVTDEHASDEQVEAIVWQLHDAAQTRSFDKLHISQTFIDKRDPIVFIHIYRGSKCAPEKYAPGQPPCGGSYHGAGDYTLGSFKNPNRESGVLLHDEDHMVDLWNPDAPNK